jgi:putative transposase
MPDHIHLFCSPNGETNYDLRKWIQYWKSQISQSWPWIPDQPIWQRDFWDQQIKVHEKYDEKWQYVLNNPVRHGLVKDPSQWPFQGELNKLEW